MSKYRYRTLRREVRARFTVKGSRFIGTAAPAAGEKAAQSFIERIREEFPDATHHAHAYRVMEEGALVERSFDAREPAGTAGLPMLQLLQGRNLSGLAVVGTRYFGGVKLGIGGLTRAYRQCARDCIDGGEVVVRERLRYVRLLVSYEEIGALLRLLESLQGEIISTEYGAAVTVIAALPHRAAETARKRFDEISRGSGRWEPLQKPPGS
ncbi:MAG: YigZ family protein [Firmicutes bacterium]|nr:YigZ family protein [Bacillota bacterium]